MLFVCYTISVINEKELLTWCCWFVLVVSSAVFCCSSVMSMTTTRSEGISMMDNPLSWVMLAFIVYSVIAKIVIAYIKEEKRKEEEKNPKIEYDQDLIFYD